MKNSKSGKTSRHLKNSIKYILNQEKTQDGLLVGSNMLANSAEKMLERMLDTKRKFGKKWGRQGYHIIISFPEDETISPEMSHMIMEEFAEKFLQNKYECVYATHDDKKHIHSHLIFNSVNRVTGKKFRYEDGDWEKIIQPITDELCEKYGFSALNVDLDGVEKKVEKNMKYNEWEAKKKNNPTWATILKNDIDASIDEANSYSSFIRILKEKGYGVKDGKYLSLKPYGKEKARRTKQFGEEYSKESIQKRIETKKQNTGSKDSKSSNIPKEDGIDLSSFAKAHHSRLYYVKEYKYYGRWRYREDIVQLDRQQQQMKYLQKHNIDSYEKLKNRFSTLEKLEEQLKEDRHSVYKDRYPNKKVLNTYEELLHYPDTALLSASEKKDYDSLMKIIIDSGMSIKEIDAMNSKYEDQLSGIKNQMKELRSEKKVVKKIVKQTIENETVKEELKKEREQKADKRVEK